MDAPRTPKRARISKSRELSRGVVSTPSKPKHVLADGADLNLNAGRRANKEDLQEAWETPTEDFFRDYLPALRKGFDVQRIIKVLQANKKLVTVDGALVWPNFSQEPRKRNQTEDACFSALAQVAKDIVDTCRSVYNVESPWVCVCNPNRAPQGPRKSSSSCRPDCYMIPKSAKTDSVFWHEIAVSFEFKKDENTSDVNRVSLTILSMCILLTRLQNVEQLVWDIRETMRLDPTRRFTFGVSIENTGMRIWYIDRSNIIISELFDFMKVCRYDCYSIRYSC